MDAELWFGEGSIKQVSSGRRQGKWRLQWSFWDADANRRAFVDRYFDRQREAERWRDDKKIELRSGANPTAPRRSALTLQAWYDLLAGSKDEGYADGIWVASGSTPQTVGVKASRWSKWIKGDPIAAVPVARLNRDHARAHLRRMKEAGATHSTVVDVVGVLKKVVNDAIRERPEARDLMNPFEKLPLRTHEEAVLAAIETQERERVEGPSVALVGPKAVMPALCRLSDPKRKAHLAVHLLAGLRLGEQMALCREQLDFTRGVIVVDRAVHVGPTGEQWVGLPKRSKIRLCAMCPTLAAILREYVALMPDGQSHLFPAASEDKPRMKKLVYATWREVRKEAKLSSRMLPKGCRASFNNWAEKLMPLVSESTRLEHMGHSVRQREGQSVGIVVNLRNYTGHIPEGYEILRREIERLITKK